MLIIGEGILGILTSFLLKERGKSSVVLESRNITAKATVQHGSIYSSLIKKGTETAAAYYKINSLAPDKYKKLSEAVKFDFEQKDN